MRKLDFQTSIPLFQIKVVLRFLFSQSTSTIPRSLVGKFLKFYIREENPDTKLQVLPPPKIFESIMFDNNL